MNTRVYNHSDCLHYISDFIVAFLILDVKWWGWTGLNDREKEGEYKWSDGSFFNYSNWKPGEPSGRGRDDDDVSKTDM